VKQKKATILHADDEISWREYVKALFSDRYLVESVKDFESTLARIDKGGIDLLILDHLMPGTQPKDDAAAVCSHLRRKYPSLPVIVFTGALANSPTTREDMERMIGAPVVCKEDVESEAGDLSARVEESLDK
jgi:DNA-binding NtrC family response regulator